MRDEDALEQRMANYAMPTHLKEQCLLTMHLEGTIDLLPNLRRRFRYWKVDVLRRTTFVSLARTCTDTFDELMVKLGLQSVEQMYALALVTIWFVALGVDAVVTAATWAEY